MSVVKMVAEEFGCRLASLSTLLSRLMKLMRGRSKPMSFLLILTSATLDAEKFSGYFFNFNIFTIPGRTFSAEIMYTEQLREETEYTCQSLYERMKGIGKNVLELIILPAYSALPSEMQSRRFDPAPPGERKVVVVTNIAEASLTIDAKFFQPEGDHLTLLAVYEAWKAKNFSRPRCFEHFVQLRSLRRAQDARKQLLTIMDRYGN
ncbi:hypothetical protein MKX03_008526 [Papaver bracteatum]|nr:hypothetical protein MKX03_008526 [Papaver bracteatum]